MRTWAARTAVTGAHLAVHTAVGGVTVWDLDSLRAELRELGMDWQTKETR